MAETRRDISFVINGKDVSAPAFRSAMTNMQRLQKQATDTQAAFKFVFGATLGVGLTAFLKKTIQEAGKAGSELQKALGASGVSAVGELREALGGVKLGVQSATLSILNEFVPALRTAAEIAKTINQRIGGGQVGVGADVGAERRTARGAPLSGIREQAEAAEGQLSRLQRERNRVWNARGFTDYIDTITGVRSNRLAVLDAQIETAALEAGSLRAAVGNLERAEGGSAFIGMLRRGAGIAGQAGRGLIGNAPGTGQYLRDYLGSELGPAGRALRDLAGVGGTVGNFWAKLIGYRGKPPDAEVPSELPGMVPGLGVTEARFLTRGRDADRREIPKLLEQMNRQLGELVRQGKQPNKNLEVTLK